jgi:hypothetical protein
MKTLFAVFWLSVNWKKRAGALRSGRVWLAVRADLSAPREDSARATC